MSNSNDVREQVSKAYTSAVRAAAPQQVGCCQAAPKGVVVKSAGYTAEELQALPDDAVVNSFGCGNPLAYSAVESGQVVLDLGSGAGIDILLAAQKVGPTGRVIGIDMTDEMIARANENIAASGLTNVEVRKGIIEELPVEDASVDWVISNCVINLSPEKSKVFAQIVRVLKPGGQMLVSDIVIDELPAWVYQSKALYNSCLAGAIGEDAYLTGLREAGMAEVEVRERIVYDISQLTAFVKSELPDQSNENGCCAVASGFDSLEEATKELVGKVWSAKIYARKK